VPYAAALACCVLLPRKDYLLLSACSELLHRVSHYVCLCKRLCLRVLHYYYYATVCTHQTLTNRIEDCIANTTTFTLLHCSSAYEHLCTEILHITAVTTDKYRTVAAPLAHHFNNLNLSQTATLLSIVRRHYRCRLISGVYCCC
jgi:hypothetical protein